VCCPPFLRKNEKQTKITKQIIQVPFFCDQTISMTAVPTEAEDFAFFSSGLAAQQRFWPRCFNTMRYMRWRKMAAQQLDDHLKMLFFWTKCG
jgi:hypothetical protein